mmetsp:Transcript_2465/g.5856  ORF Transcript_2465/g.5856 Transcript_2465/m.5856 type:complete len:206 (-) Transcript_2465:140-757(-)
MPSVEKTKVLGTQSASVACVIRNPLGSHHGRRLLWRRIGHGGPAERLTNILVKPHSLGAVCALPGRFLGDSISRLPGLHALQPLLLDDFCQLGLLLLLLLHRCCVRLERRWWGWRVDLLHVTVECVGAWQVQAIQSRLNAWGSHHSGIVALQAFLLGPLCGLPLCRQLALALDFVGGVLLAPQRHCGQCRCCRLLAPFTHLTLAV